MRFPSSIWFALALFVAPFLHLSPHGTGGASRSAIQRALSPPSGEPGSAQAAQPEPAPLVHATLPPPTPRITPQEGWKLTYASGPDQTAQGSLEKLVNAIKRQDRIGFAFGTFDGTVSGVCKSATLGKDGEIDCEAEIWCNQPNDSLPDRHGHTLHLRSTGAVTYAVITLNEIGDRKILALGDTDTLVAWYLK